MPLSEYEQRMLSQMEDQLRADDPHLADSFSSSTNFDLRHIVVGVFGVIAGIGILVAGVATSWSWLGVIGFLLMVAGVLYALSSPGTGGGSNESAPTAGKQPSATSSSRSSFMERQQERWENRDDRRRGE